VTAALIVLALNGVGARQPSSQTLPRVAPDAIGLAPAVLDEASALLTQLVADRTIAGAVAAVARHGRIGYQHAVGVQDLATGAPMSERSLFRIYSMAKPITAVAVMMLYDEGKFRLDDPVQRYLPEFAVARVVDAPGGTPRQPVRPVTIEDLLLHTSGLSHRTSDLYRTLAVRSRADSLPEFIGKITRAPLMEDPHTRFRYSEGTTVLGRLVEIWSGRPFDLFLERRVFQPLGMTDTAFYLSEDQNKRLSKTYKRTTEGKLEVGENPILHGRSPTDRERFPAANGGLFSTAGDYLKFCQMLLNNGEFNGHRILKADTVRAFRTIHTGAIKTGFTPGNGWGVGCCVVREPQGPTAALSAGSFGHGGAHGTQAWIDPTNNRIYLLMIQRTNIGNSDAGDLRKTFQDEAAAALNKAPTQ